MWMRRCACGARASAALTRHYRHQWRSVSTTPHPQSELPDTPQPFASLTSSSRPPKADETSLRIPSAGKHSGGSVEGQEQTANAATPLHTMPTLRPPPLRPGSDVHVETHTSSIPTREDSGGRVVKLFGDGDRYGVQAALFGLSDLLTGPTTYPNPEERVATRMDLLPPPAKAHLFTHSGWTAALSESLAIGEREEEEENAARSTITTSVGGVRSAASPDVYATLDRDRDVYADILGRGKVLRCFLHRYLQRPDWWYDATQELLDLAVAQLVQDCLALHLPNLDQGSALAPQDRERLDEVVRGCSLRASDHVLQRDESVVFYSPGLKAKLGSLLDAEERTQDAFAGPMATWDAYVVAHRQDATTLACPQKPPFSFGETSPSLTLNDVERREYTDSVKQEEELLEAIRNQERHSRQLARHAATWHTLSEEKQNELLFGSSTATVSRDGTRRGGIYVVDVPADDDVVFSDMTESSPSVRGNAKPGTRTEEEEIDPDQEAAKEDEHSRAQVYKVDDFYLGIIEPLTPHQRTICAYVSKVRSEGHHPPVLAPAQAAEDNMVEEGQDGAEADGQEDAEAKKVLRRRKRQGRRAPGHEYLPGGTFRHAVTGVVEDVHLSKLWVGFQNEEASVLLDTVAALRGGGWRTCVQHQIRRELATQAAFLLLFFSRDEVRAVTPPQDTYARLWALHNELKEVLWPVVQRGIEREMPWVMVEPSPSPSSQMATRLPDFSSLSLDAQASYTCFGAVHLPSIRIRPSVDAAAIVTSPLPLREANPLLRSPSSLFDALVEEVRQRHAGRQREESDGVGDSTAITDHPATSATAAYEALSGDRKLALDFPFPLDAFEEAEAAGRCLVSGDDEAATDRAEEVVEDASVVSPPSSAVPATLDGPFLDAVAAEATAGLPALWRKLSAAAASSPTTTVSALRAQVEAAVRAHLAPLVEHMTSTVLAELLAGRRRSLTTTTTTPPGHTDDDGGDEEPDSPITAAEEDGRRVRATKRGQGRPPLSAEERERRRRSRVTARGKEQEKQREQVPSRTTKRRGRPPKHAAPSPMAPATPTRAIVDEHYTDDVASIMAEMNVQKLQQSAKKLPRRKQRASRTGKADQGSGGKGRGRPRSAAAASRKVRPAKERTAPLAGKKRRKDSATTDMESVATQLKHVSSLLAALTKGRKA